MKADEKIIKMVNTPGRIGILATSGEDGSPNAAVFGSAHMTDPETLMLCTGDNRTYQNLQKNPHACLLVISEPGGHPAQWKGRRLYLKVDRIETRGKTLENFKKQAAEIIGEETAEMLHAVVVFKLTDIRPLIDITLGL